ncbi:2-methylaconitate cis-trans isomerase PrpF [Cobetia crustatorum]|uniref:2-methylaconitate cis-trans isomerase PrpF n=1 Tax=Cobetia crustatorum TaxID=553385 RepID=UPI00046984EE|nr:2-methylaconitate cis-trans isomerase PrpF [Cobetia crustatorum]
MSRQPQLKIPATYLRGGTSKGVFFLRDELPEAAQVPGPVRDALLLRVIGSPDPYAKQIDGMGGATSSTSKTVIISKSEQPGHDVDYLFGQVSIDSPFVDWSGNCGNLSAAVGPFAIEKGLVSAERLPQDGIAEVRIWQANISKTIIARVPMHEGCVQETGDFELDGVTFPAAEVAVAFRDPAAGEGSMFPTGNVIDVLEVPESVVAGGRIEATLINAGIPTIFVRAEDLGYSGTELQDAINGDAAALARLEMLRAYGALHMGLINDLAEAATRQHTPKVAFVAAPADHMVSSGREIKSGEIDVLIRAMSMGKLHHAMMGTAAVAIAAAAAVPGTLVNLAANAHERSEGAPRDSVCFGHPSGTLRVGASAEWVPGEGKRGEWQVSEAVMSRSARILMEGWIRVPSETLVL